MQLLGAVDALLESMHTPMLSFDHECYDNTLASLRSRLEPAAFDGAWAEGRAFTMEQAVAYALND